MKLAKNFPLAEMTRSQTATRKGWANQPDEGALKNLIALAENTLQPIRNVLGAVYISSGFRGEKLNRKIGGAKHSQHTYGQACDFNISGLTSTEVCQWVTENGIPFDQLIDEGDWVHISFSRSHNRRTVLTAVFSAKNETSYVEGLSTRCIAY